MLRLGRGARLRSDDEQRLLDLDLAFQSAHRSRHGGIEHVKLGISVEFAEAAGEDLRTQTGASHAEHDGVFESLAADLVGKGFRSSAFTSSNW